MPTIDRAFDDFGQSPRLLCSPRLVVKRINDRSARRIGYALRDAGLLALPFGDESHAQIFKALHPAHQRCCEKSRKGRFAIEKPYEIAATLLQASSWRSRSLNLQSASRSSRVCTARTRRALRSRSFIAKRPMSGANAPRRLGIAINQPIIELTRRQPRREARGE